MKALSILSSFLLFVVPSFDAQAIDVAVVETAGGGYGGGAAVVAQLNDDTFFDFTATLVDPSGVDSAAELASYDAVVLGGSGLGNDPIWSTAMANALKVFVEGGGGVLMTGWGQFNSFSAGLANASPAATRSQSRHLNRASVIGMAYQFNWWSRGGSNPEPADYESCSYHLRAPICAKQPQIFLERY